MKTYNDAVKEMLDDLTTFAYENNFAPQPFNASEVLQKLTDRYKTKLDGSVPLGAQVSRDCARTYPQYIMSETIAHGEREYHHLEILFKTDSHIKFKDVDSGLITVLPIKEYETLYRYEEQLEIK